MLTDQQHPITPPPDLMEQWREEADKQLSPYYDYIATQAARWGADQELQACLQLLDINGCPSKWIDMLRAARRPKKPPSLAEEALTALDEVNEWAVENMRQFAIHDDLVAGVAAIRYALERLQELENNDN